MTKRNKNRATRQENYLGINGVTQSARTTFGVNPDRLSNSRPVTLNADVSMNATDAYLKKEQLAIGRHQFGALANPAAIGPQDAVPGVPTKVACYNTTNSGKHLMASTTTVKKSVSNGKTRVVIDLPYYDRNAVDTLLSSNVPGAVAPVGSFKVAVEIMGGGILTGTDPIAMKKLDGLLQALLHDAMGVVDRVPDTKPRYAAASHGVIPESSTVLR